MKELFKSLTKFELILWISSVVIVSSAYIISGGGDVLTGLASVIGVTALIFVAKGYVIGQLLCLAFALIYGIISFYFKYYGETITYLGMTAPSALAAVISWLRHPYKESKEVEVASVNKKQIALMCLLTVIVTTVFYFILSALGTTNLFFSTLSIATSFAASYLTFLRSPYYAIAYSLNDLVLIVLWTAATIQSISYLPMIFCFVCFLANDLYGFYNWRRIKKKQSSNI